MRELFELLIAKRVDDPRDLISRLSQGNEISPQETMCLCRLLLIAGFKTTVNLIFQHGAGAAGQAVVAAGHREPSTRRYGSEGSPAVGRVHPAGRKKVALEDVALEGQVIRKGKAVGLLLGAANRNTYVYANPGSSMSCEARAAPDILVRQHPQLHGSPAGTA